MELPLFPLSSVLLPFGRMPLRIFERRYLDLVRDSMRSGQGFGIVGIRSGEEVGDSELPRLEAVGTLARIVDWDQLEDGLLGITVLGVQRCRLERHWRADSGLCIGEVELLPAPQGHAMETEWQPFARLLKGLEAHPHVQRIGMQPDLEDAWEVAYSLLQLLPLEESFKAQLLALDDVEEILAVLGTVLSETSGEE